VVSDADLARYDAMAEALFTPDLANWVSNGQGKGSDKGYAVTSPSDAEVTLQNGAYAAN
jgi:hypothetical protein